MTIAEHDLILLILAFKHFWTVEIHISGQRDSASFEVPCLASNTSFSLARSQSRVLELRLVLANGLALLASVCHLQAST
eukprot:CAMPEP_0119342092 /NCGR_PEP_ID=MMETSP1333-20130426/103991_1 /TAXON_ID=418940 /ORGANISM="Scyphosphaera apsteinii, Strain RCC1455" /LENGTH=78 /DNA_ID=CAMNT_0007354237 /DNA_START=72 /DNA_END=309 /DNA_ORIENTATION=-